MTTQYIILLFFFFFNLILILNFSKIKFFKTNIDKPDNKRKIHLNPTPLAGGLIIYLNILIYSIILNFSDILINQETIFGNINSFNIFMLVASSIFLLGFLDDKYNIKANTKFYILIILIFILLLLDRGLIVDNIKFSFYQKNIFLNNYDIFFSIFCFLVFLNAFNMFDGINLQSSTYSILIFFCILLFFLNSLIISLLIISLIGFSYLNFKNKSFLGDSGSLLLAFIISYFFIKLYNLGYIKYADQIVIYMLIPGLDLIRLFIFRILKKRNPLSPDRLHLHHILIKKFSLPITLLIIIFLIIFPVILDYSNLNNIFTLVITSLLYFFIVSITYQKK
jgi:UDP-GlcNAc:undecaprenyl-phosphate/decaprenyl-phosphate GlcNAc-1-phosphate transferase